MSDWEKEMARRAEEIRAATQAAKDEASAAKRAQDEAALARAWEKFERLKALHDELGVWEKLAEIQAQVWEGHGELTEAAIKPSAGWLDTLGILTMLSYSFHFGFPGTYGVSHGHYSPLDEFNTYWEEGVPTTHHGSLTVRFGVDVFTDWLHKDDEGGVISIINEGIIEEWKDEGRGGEGKHSSDLILPASVNQPNAIGRYPPGERVFKSLRPAYSRNIGEDFRQAILDTLVFQKGANMLPTNFSERLNYSHPGWTWGRLS